MNKIDSLTDDEVRQVSQLIEALDRSTLDFLQLDAGGVKVTISKGGAAMPVQSFQPPAFAHAAPAPQSVAPQAMAPAIPAPAASLAPAATAKPKEQERARPDDGSVEVTAPLMGRFYSRPEPGSPPFVTVGSQVEADTAVGLIEVMKLFNTVEAGVRGTIIEVCIPDSEFIEFGTALFRVRPSDSGAQSSHLRGS